MHNDLYPSLPSPPVLRCPYLSYKIQLLGRRSTELNTLQRVDVNVFSLISFQRLSFPTWLDHYLVAGLENSKISKYQKYEKYHDIFDIF